MERAEHTCPKCGRTMEHGFHTRGSGLWYVPVEKLQRFAFRDDDLTKAGMRRLLPAKAEYYLAYLCRECRYYAVDYEKSLDRAEAKALSARPPVEVAKG